MPICAGRRPVQENAVSGPDHDGLPAESARGGGHRELAVLAGLLVLLAVPRLVVLGADPPPGLMLDYLTDEGWWAHNARDHALFGRWIMDDHNEALFWAPLYTGALRLMYAVTGVGLVPTRLLAALAGLATCAVVYAFVRASHGWKAASVATLLLGTDYFFLTNNRIGYVESFQAVFMTAACLAVVAAGSRRGSAFAAGALVTASLMAKVSAVVLGGIVVVYWLAWLVLRRGSSSEIPAFAWRCPVDVAIGAMAAAVLAYAVIQPDPTLLGAKTEQRTGMTTSHNPVLSLATLGLQLPNDRIATSGFVTGSLPLLVTALVLAVRALAYRARPLAHGARAFDPLALMCWCWLAAGSVQVGLLRLWQPDRRYLFLVPPLAILAALELTRGGRDDAARGITRPRLFAASVLIAVFVGFAARGPWSKWLHVNGGGMGPSPAAAIVWFVMAAGVVPLAWMGLRLAARGRWPSVPLAPVALGYVLLGLGPLAAYLTHPTWAMRSASETMTAIARELPPERRIAVGDFADTFGMESDLFAFVIRSWPEKNMFMNLDGWERFRPAIALDEGPPAVERADFERRTTLALAPDGDGVPRRLIDVRVERRPAEGK